MFKYGCCFLLLMGFLACNNNLEFSRYQSLKGGNWAADESVHFEFTAPDTVNRHQLFIHVRNEDSFPFSNLFLITELTFPGGNTIRDTLEYEMAYPDGRWMGKGSGSLKENKLWYKENIVFPFNGVYTLEVSQAMRRNGQVEGIQELPGITDVGLEIEKSK